MHTVTSADGTRIAYWRTGSGPPLVLVHGATADHTTTWQYVLPELERHFTVHAMDRRGRGGSADASAYALQREAEDVAAVVAAAGDQVNVLGHSYGALCALEAATLTTKLRRLILYEGVPLPESDGRRPELLQRFDALLAAGDMETLLVCLYRDLVEMSPEEISLLRANHEAWAARLVNVRTMPRELRGEYGYVFAPDRFRTMRAPTMLLVGGDSPAHELANARGVADALPDARVGVLPGQQHIAMYTAPEAFVGEVLRFLTRAPVHPPGAPRAPSA